MDELKLKSSGIQFEVATIHENLFIVRNKSNLSVIGYINKAPSEAWIWFAASDVSANHFNTITDAVENLVQTFMIYKMDAAATKIGIIDNPEYVKK
jgi:hypothetical protein